MAMAVIIGVPVALIVAATALVAFGRSDAADGAAVTLYGIAVLVALGTLLIRAGLASTEDRDREEAARRFFDEHGRWPGTGDL